MTGEDGPWCLLVRLLPTAGDSSEQEQFPDILYTYKALQHLLPPTLYYSTVQGAMLAGTEDKSFLNRPIGTEFYLTFP